MLLALRLLTRFPQPLTAGDASEPATL